LTVHVSPEGNKIDLEVKAMAGVVRRRVKDRGGQPVVEATGMIVTRFRLGAVEYVHRYNRCGKACEVCKPGGLHYDRNRPGHGPYWYKVIHNGKLRIKKYCGVDCPVAEVRGVLKEVKENDDACVGGDDVGGVGDVLRGDSSCPPGGAAGGLPGAGDDLGESPIDGGRDRDGAEAV
jgi:hypothetical protein